MTRSSTFTFALIAGLCMAATASAQSTATADTSLTVPATAPSDSVSNGGPRMASLATGIHRASTVEESASVQRRQPQSVGKPVALMIVGGSAIVLGAVIDGDVGTIFMVGGAVALLIGLYDYLK